MGHLVRAVATIQVVGILAAFAVAFGPVAVAQDTPSAESSPEPSPEVCDPECRIDNTQVATTMPEEPRDWTPVWRTLAVVAGACLAVGVLVYALRGRM